MKKTKKKHLLMILLTVVVLIGAVSAIIHKTKPGSETENIKNPVSCIIEIRCDSVLDNMDLLSNPGLKKYIPDDGIVLPPTEVVIEEGQTVYDALKKITDEKGIHLESQVSPGFQSRYVQGMNHLYEKNVGQYSGWLYFVNDEMPDYGCSEQIVAENDKILWEYTCGE